MLLAGFHYTSKIAMRLYTIVEQSVNRILYQTI
jgi:hypothetical protein